MEPLCGNLLCFATQRLHARSQWKMGASRFLAAAAASVILLCFASESRESQCNGCMKVANAAPAADFSHCGIDVFSLKNRFKTCFKIIVFLLWRRDPVLELQFVEPLCGNLLCFATHAFADRRGR